MLYYIKYKICIMYKIYIICIMYIFYIFIYIYIWKDTLFLLNTEAAVGFNY